MSGLRFSANAARTLREAISEAGGVEVFAIGDVDERGIVQRLEIHCRGVEDAVPALLLRPRAGQVVIHNHPSGDLRPSGADFELANRYGDEGIGVAIVDSQVTRDFWVVEPARRVRQPIDRERLRGFFERDLPRILPDAEMREGQLQMALAVAERLDSGGVLVVEAGTGTGKSLAYLVPSVLWALANDSKVAVATYTRTLQAQLLRSDLPLMRRAGLVFEAALLKGRSNYLCRRKLDVALREIDGDRALLERIQAWTEVTDEGSMQDLSEDVDPELWERLESDSDQTLRARCPHYNECFYYRARRKAAASHLLILNHALVVADLAVKAETGGDGVVPRYGRLILDEGHHLQDAATSATSERLTRLAITRAIAPLLPRRRRPGALHRVAERFGGDRPRLQDLCTRMEHDLGQFRDTLEPAFSHVGDVLLKEPQRRLRPQDGNAPDWLEAREVLFEVGKSMRRLHDRLGVIEGEMEGLHVPVDFSQPVLDLTRGTRRLGDKLSSLRRLVELRDGAEQWCRWVERDRRDNVALCLAPIDVAPVLQDLMFSRMEAVGITSATLAVRDRFDHFLDQVGLVDGAQEPDDEDPRIPAALLQVPSPFDYRRQATLLLPRDLPDPRKPDWLERVADATVQLVQATRGGAFVLCTSHATVRALGDHLQRAVGDDLPVLRQGRGSRERLLRRFRDTRGAILVGTDSFWEGVSVKGDSLRLVVIPRLPFRVPTEPVSQARYERVQSLGQDPFRVYSLPEAVLKLRQGFGRLIRSKQDRGAVAILDRRLHDAWYGRLFLGSLPPAGRAVGPLKRLIAGLPDPDAPDRG